jgi:hypothetical protein
MVYGLALILFSLWILDVPMMLNHHDFIMGRIVTYSASFNYFSSCFTFLFTRWMEGQISKQESVSTALTSFILEDFLDLTDQAVKKKLSSFWI